jgi:glycosyltransferase involved in cell wall biosynthesis
MEIKVSGVIPAYNAEVTIAAAIESTLNQTYPLLEVIVVDDGSSDRTAEIVSRYPVRLIRQPNAGVARARNAGIEAAQGDWIALLDSDDTWKPEKTAVQVRYIEPSVGVIYSNRPPEITFEKLWRGRLSISPSGALVRKSIFQEIGGFDSRLQGTEDLNLWQRISRTDWRFVNAGPSLFQYSPGNESLSGNNAKMAADELRNVEIIGALFQLKPEEIEEQRHWIRLEYARNLISERKYDAARSLLVHCHGAAALLLKLAIATRIRRMARIDALRLLASR